MCERPLLQRVFHGPHPCPPSLTREIIEALQVHLSQVESKLQMLLEDKTLKKLEKIFEQVEDLSDDQGHHARALGVLQG